MRAHDSLAPCGHALPSASARRSTERRRTRRATRLCVQAVTSGVAPGRAPCSGAAVQGPPARRFASRPSWSRSRRAGAGAPRLVCRAGLIWRAGTGPTRECGGRCTRLRSFSCCQAGSQQALRGLPRRAPRRNLTQNQAAGERGSEARRARAQVADRDRVLAVGRLHQVGPGQPDCVRHRQRVRQDDARPDLLARVCGGAAGAGDPVGRRARRRHLLPARQGAVLGLRLRPGAAPTWPGCRAPLPHQAAALRCRGTAATRCAFAAPSPAWVC